MEEIWKQHPICQDYEGSNLGRVRTTNYYFRGETRILPQTFGRRYWWVSVRIDGKKRKTYSVSRFVYECFNGVIPQNMEIDHIDRNTSNNKIENLRLCSHKGNMNNPLTMKATFGKGKMIAVKDLETKIITIYPSIGVATKNIGVGAEVLTKRANGYEWRENKHLINKKVFWVNMTK